MMPLKECEHRTNKN